MPSYDLDLLKIGRGMVTAPAGCGKTQLISTALKQHAGDKPVLVLTHTNAGVAALGSRLAKDGVPAKSYRLATIDGWAMRLVSIFPNRAAISLDLLRLANPGTDYPNIRAAAAKMLKAGHINDVLKASYSHLLVDEYQDCSVRQHALVFYAAQCLPTCVLADPLQAIFGFGSDPLARWEDVCAHFPIQGELDIPHRWINAGNEPLGRWLLQGRQELLAGRSIDLTRAPEGVHWVKLDGNDDHEKLLAASRLKMEGKDERVIIIGDSMRPESRYKIAKSVAGAVTVEAVDLKDLVGFSRTFDLTSTSALEQLANFAQSLMSNVGAADLVKRVSSLMRETARKEPSDLERVAVSFATAPTHQGAINLLAELTRDGGVQTYRPGVLRACMKAMQTCVSDSAISFHDAAIKVREQNRVMGRPLPKRSIGSTLLLKGLEGEAVVVLNAGELDAKNLYVAMTRGSRKLVVCSPNHLLSPRS